jgi:hypothetical protein
VCSSDLGKIGVCALEALLAQQVLSGATYTKALELHAVAGKHLRTTGLSPEDRRACAAETTEDALELLTHVDPMTRAAALTRTTRNVFLGSRFGVFQMALHSRLQMAADSVRELCLRYCNEVMRGLEPYMTCGNDIVCKRNPLFSSLPNSNWHKVIIEGKQVLGPQ